MGKFAENLNLGKRVLPPPPAKGDSIRSISTFHQAKVKFRRDFRKKSQEDFFAPLSQETTSCTTCCIHMPRQHSIQENYIEHVMSSVSQNFSCPD